MTPTRRKQSTRPRPLCNKSNTGLLAAIFLAGMVSAATFELVHAAAAWSERLPQPQKDLYVRVMHETRQRGLNFAIGGGFARNAYTGLWRNTKDLDLFVLRRDRERFISLLQELSLVDYYDRKPYDRSWIYRACCGDQIVDVIWEMANHRACVDEIWLESGPSICIDGENFQVIPPEETLWTKLYVLQRERCDWPDALNLIGAVGPELNWARLLDRVGEDAPLLAAALSVFSWVCPRRALELPAWIWPRLQIARPREGDAKPELLDSRPWMIGQC